MYGRKNKDPKMEAYLDCKELIDQASTINKLTRAVERIMEIAKQHKFDEVQMEILERAGMNKYERINRETVAMMRNKKV